MDDLLPTSFRISKDLKKRLKQACLDRETDQTGALHEALEGWLRGSAAGQDPEQARAFGPPNPHAEYHAMLDEIIDHGTEADIIGIQANLRWGSESVRRAALSGRRRKASNE